MNLCRINLTTLMQNLLRKTYAKLTYVKLLTHMQNRPRIDPEILVPHSINSFTDNISTMNKK